jgi:hypothetical protein
MKPLREGDKNQPRRWKDTMSHQPTRSQETRLHTPPNSINFNKK